ncbi:MAG: head decoration protein [Candidimonas sp.]|nr:MAG: head decoration protein [Candidimonas sp.]TAM23757.1 MAG: head decoration protein [Candidimonas sp.]
MGTPTTTPLYEHWHDGGFIISQAVGHRSVDKILLSMNAVVYQAGTVLGKQTTGTTAAATALGTNTGTGTFGAIAVGAGALPGVYAVEFDDATHYVVEDPNGAEVGHGVAGVAFSAGGLGFTITAGGTAFVPADSFAVTVAAGSGKFAPLSLTATDGTVNAAGILYGLVDATAADASGTGVVRAAEVNGNELIWPTGATGGQIAAATAQLTALGIIVR